LIASATSIPAEVSNDITTNDEQLVIEKIDIEPQFLYTNAQQVDPNLFQSYPMAKAGPIFELVGDQLHPAFGRSGSDISAAFYDFDLDQIIYTGSVDDGASWVDGVYWDVAGDYPSIKVWDSSPRFFGTFVTDYLDLNGGATYLFECTDPITPDPGYALTYWDWSSYGWSDMIDADIACDNSQSVWEWGVSTYVISSTYGEGYTDGPTVVYSDEEEEGNGWISWFYTDGCAHTDVDIDHSTIYSYAVYDWYDPDVMYWKLLVRVQDFALIETGYDELFELDTGANVEYPAVAAGDGNVVIVAETDVNGNKDIMCFYGTDLNSMSTSFVVDTGDDERYPDVRHVNGQKFICTYVKDGDIYAMTTEDAGATWSDSKLQLNDNTGAVVEEYKTSDLCENAVKAWWEELHDDIDIYGGFAIQNDPPGAPTIDGPTSGKTGTEYTYTFTATDPDGDAIAEFTVNWGDGVIETVAGPSGATASHSWAERGDYVISATAKDVNGLVGPEGTLSVSIPRVRSFTMLQSIFEMFPNAFPILRALLGF
jgi:hypothetical protein